MAARPLGKKEYAVLATLFSLCVLGGVLFALHENEYWEIFQSKTLHASQATTPRRILLTGGSNVVWGYRSKIIEDELKISTTNLALSREGGDPVNMRDLALRTVRKGDIVVYSSVLFWNERNLDKDVAKELRRVAKIDPSGTTWDRLLRKISWYWVPLPIQDSLIDDAPAIYRKYLGKKPSPFLDRYSPYGDIKNCEKGDVQPRGFEAPPDPSVIADLKIFRDRLHAMGAELVVEYPWLYVKKEERQKWLEQYRDSFAEMKKEFTVATPQLNRVFKSDRDIFCNTHNHLNDEYAEVRSREMAGYLKRFLNSKS